MRKQLICDNFGRKNLVRGPSNRRSLLGARAAKSLSKEKYSPKGERIKIDLGINTSLVFNIG